MKGRLVTNTGPIIALGSIDHLEILKEIFEEVILPEAVHREIMKGGKDFIGLEFYRRATWTGRGRIGASGMNDGCLTISSLFNP